MHSDSLPEGTSLNLGRDGLGSPTQQPRPAEEYLSRSNQSISAAALTVSAVIVGGGARSGTTLMTDVLNESPLIGIFGEYPLSALIQSLEQVFSWSGEHRKLDVSLGSSDPSLLDEKYTGNSIVRKENLPPFYSLRGNLRALKYDKRYPERQDMQEATTRLVAFTLGKETLSIVGSKIPNINEETNLNAIRRLYGRCRFVLMIRNPQGTINSIINRRNLTAAGLDSWGISDVGAALELYRANILSTISLITDYPEDCFVVKYEDLLESELDVVRRLEEFLQTTIPFSGLSDSEREPLNVLTQDELSLVRRVYAEAIDNWHALPLTGPGVQVLRHLNVCIPVVPVGIYLPVLPQSSIAKCLGSGWHGVEAAGVWSSREKAHVFFRAVRMEEVLVQLELEPLPQKDTFIELSISLNGQRLFHGVLLMGEIVTSSAEIKKRKLVSYNSQPVRFLLGPISLQETTPNHLILESSPVKSPAEIGLSGDGRKLGIKLHSVKLINMRNFS